MQKYGLNDKIIHIQTLNSKISNIIGKADKVSPKNIDGNKIFPYQRRNRSTSPIKDTALIPSQ